jgi:hypothetical protein
MTPSAINGLFLDYIRTGIIQFGKFQQPDGSLGPVACHFTLLPSFPKFSRSQFEYNGIEKDGNRIMDAAKSLNSPP